MKTIKLLCLPYAGGTAMVYSKWKPYLKPDIELIPLELAGRGRRIKEEFYEGMSDAIDDIYKKIEPIIDNSDYAFFGHSMGTVIALELCYRIMANKKRCPIHLFMSGRYPPHIVKEKEYLSRLPDNEFVDEILKIGGTSKEVFENSELSKLFIPILKSDYKLIEEYKYIERSQKLNCGITVFNGTADYNMVYSDMLRWADHTTGQCSVYEFEGGHFFIHNYLKEITSIINRAVEGCTT